MHRDRDYRTRHCRTIVPIVRARNVHERAVRARSSRERSACSNCGNRERQGKCLCARERLGQSFYNGRERQLFDTRGGSVLLVVLVLVTLLSLGAYTYTSIMSVEYEAALAHGRQVQTAAFAESGVELIASVLANRSFDENDNLYHNPDSFHGIVMREGDLPREVGHVSIVVPYENDPNSKIVRYGLINESSKLNLNTLFDLDFGDGSQSDGSNSSSATSGSSSSSGSTSSGAQQNSSSGASTGSSSGSTSSGSSSTVGTSTVSTDDALHDLLLQIPNMTDELADAILDFIDEDDDIRTYGAESEYYQSLPNPYSAKNGQLSTFEELLKVRGVTPELLFGEDANRNGLLDPNENDAAATAPLDNADGVLDPGWSAWLTAYSRETNLRADGQARIHLNQDLLTELYDELEPEFGQQVSQFITAYRIYGALDAEEQDAGSQLNQAQQQAVKNVAGAIAGGAEGETTRAGLDLSQGSGYTIRSVFDLYDIEIQAEVDGTQTTLVSPFTTANMSETLPLAWDALSTTEDEYIDGRIDVNQARVEVLMTIPGMDVTTADTIVGSSAIGPDGEPLPDIVAHRATPGWLVMDGLIDIVKMRQLAPYMTTRGDVFRAQIVGYFEQGGPFTRLETVIDATEVPGKVTFLRDLSMLGKGFSDQHLQPYRFVAE